MLDLAALQKLLEPLFPGLMGVRITEAAPDRVVAEMPVRADLCTAGGILHGGAYHGLRRHARRGGNDPQPAAGKRTTTTDSSTKFIAGARVGHDRHRRVPGPASRPHDDGLADLDQERRRQALRRGHADPAGARRLGLGTGLEGEMNAPSTSFDGGCTCRQVRYRLTSRPLFVHCCHCRWCQRETGTAFALNALIEADRVQLLAGEVDVVDTPSNSGKGQRISRCPTCRIAVWSNYGGGGDAVRFIRVGTLDEPDRFPPDVHIFTASKQPWVVLPPGTPAVAEYYKASELWPAESLERRAALVARDVAALGRGRVRSPPLHCEAIRHGRLPHCRCRRHATPTVTRTTGKGAGGHRRLRRPLSRPRRRLRGARGRRRTAPPGRARVPDDGAS